MDFANQILESLTLQREEMIAFLQRLALAESPSTVPDSQAQILSILLESLQGVGFDVELVPGRLTGGHLQARSQNPSPSGERQLVLGHCDTVWPIGTLKKMPFTVNSNVVKGPGVYDMKGGLTQMIFAFKTMNDLGLKPQLQPLVFINSDEEIGSSESEPHIRRLAGNVRRVFVLEPSLGLEGKLKTARKGVGRFEVVVTGRAAHAGLDPEKGISAVLELSYIVQKLFAMNNLASGISVNVGLIEGGLRPNVIAPHGRAVVDVRVPSVEVARQVKSAILGLETVTPGTSLQVTGQISRRPLERTERNRQLWQLARELGAAIDVELEEGVAGGGSDGNTTSQYAATLDGLGAVGDGAHADHEFIYVDKMIERCALLTLLLLAPSA